MDANAFIKQCQELGALRYEGGHWTLRSADVPAHLRMDYIRLDKKEIEKLLASWTAPFETLEQHLARRMAVTPENPDVQIGDLVQVNDEDIAFPIGIVIQITDFGGGCLSYTVRVLIPSDFKPPEHSIYCDEDSGCVSTNSVTFLERHGSLLAEALNRQQWARYR